MFGFLASPRALSLVAAPGIWLLHFAAVYVFASFACNLAVRMNAAPFSLSPLGVMILTAAALAISGFGVAGTCESGEPPPQRTRTTARLFSPV